MSENMTTQATKVMKIKLEDIFLPPVQMRPVDKTGEKFKVILESLKNNGQIQPIGVRQAKREDGKKWELIFGFHRWNAASELGWTEINASIYPAETDDFDMHNLRLAENLARQESRPAELAAQFQKIIDMRPNTPYEDILNKYGYNKSPQWLKSMLKLNKLNDKAKKLVDEGRIPLYNAQQLALLDKRFQEENIESAITLNSHQMYERVQTVKNDPAYKAATGDNSPSVDDPYRGSKVRDKTELKNVHGALQRKTPTLPEIIKNDADREVAFKIIEWVLSMDPVSKAQREADAKLTASQRQKNKDAITEADKQLRSLATKSPEELARILQQIEAANSAVN